MSGLSPRRNGDRSMAHRDIGGVGAAHSITSRSTAPVRPPRDESVAYCITSSGSRLVVFRYELCRADVTG